uniref:UDP-N-acetylglucosamine--N-acetylmuramyl-(Pentapeptide) pyrophosphoryl-undecaprenol N-acetylglucosamine transferase n=1 Tax=Ananas comosus var. bracteatus TaxID=296719 RepID=A0A6V7PVF7_ANACO|nr:unnamed protein product [Ananas comosus var. bracteatus]
MMATLTSPYLSSPFSPLLLSPSSSPTTTTTTTTTIIISFTNATTFSTRNARQVPLPLLHNRQPPQRFLCCLAVDHGGAEASSPRPAAPPPAELRVALAGGGTGGHIYPAIAIADDLRSAAAAADAAPRFLFLGSASGIEASAVPAAGYEFAPVPPSRLARPLLLRPSNLLLPLRLLRSVAACLRVLRDFRPDVVVGTGGYVAFPVCLAALILNITIVIQEQNSFPGLTNRLLAPFAAKIFLAFNACVKHFPKKKCFVYATRCASPSGGSRRRWWRGRTSSPRPAPTARRLRSCSCLAAPSDGGRGYCEMESLVKNNRRLLLAPFLNAMDMAYAAADVVVSRAGAMTCTEILATGKPSILIPSPTATDDHQTKNAYIMAEVAGSKVLTEDELDSSSLATAIDEILGDKNLMAEMSEKALSVARPNASVEIARCILSLVNKPTPK